jgi:hypothetical protein
MLNPQSSKSQEQILVKTPSVTDRNAFFTLYIDKVQIKSAARIKDYLTAAPTDKQMGHTFSSQCPPVVKKEEMLRPLRRNRSTKTQKDNRHKLELPYLNQID